MTERTALYRFYGKDDVLLYVGITEHLGARWHNHSRKKSWWPEVQRQTADWYPGREEAAAAEIKAIQTEHPRYNVTYAVEILTPEQIAERERGRARLDEAYEDWVELQAQAVASKKAFFDLCAQRVRDGLDSADTIAARSRFTAVTIRKALRDRGVSALPPGPKKANTGRTGVAG